MIVYRLTRPEYEDDLSGFGASIAGGRWNHPGEFVLYTAKTASLSILEVLVHLNGSVLDVRYQLLSLEVQASIQRVTDLPRSKGDNIMKCREIGNRWLNESKCAILKVPSVLNPLEKNYLINPRHKECDLRVVDKSWYLFDGRLMRK